MKLIQNILAIDFILCLARHWLSNFKTSAYPLYWPGEDKGGGGGGQYSILSTCQDSFLSNKQQRFEESSFSSFGLSKGPCHGYPSCPTAVINMALVKG